MPLLNTFPVQLPLPSLLSPLDLHLSTELAKSVREDRKDFETSNAIDVIGLDCLSKMSARVNHHHNNFSLALVKKEKPEPESQDSKGPLACLMLPEDNAEAFKFINDEAGKIGIKLQSEEIAPRILYQAVEKVMLRVRF